MLGALISAGTSILGGLLGNKANKENNQAAAQQADKQAALQKEFAQSGIQWKVEDAKKAGIHPLYGLGANTVSYAPQSVGSTPSDFSWLGDAGQNIGRAIQSQQPASKQAAALALTASQIQLEGLQLDNDIKRQTLASAANLARQPGTGPGIPSLVAPLTSDVANIEGPTTRVQNTVEPTIPGSPHVEYGAGPELTLRKTRSGWAPVIPQQLSESFEQDWPGRYQWMFRNKLFPDKSILKFIPKRPGFRPVYSSLRGEYRYKPYPTFTKKARTYSPMGFTRR